jgi:subtilisin family serine protease
VSTEHRIVRRIVSAAALGIMVATAAHARMLDLPIRRPGVAHLAGPAYLGDRLGVKLRPSAARTTSGLAVRGARSDQIGIASLDRAARSLGGAWFEPEFKGETPPVDPNATDFTTFYLVHLPAGAELSSALDEFASLDEVERAEPIAVLPLTAVPDDSLWSGSTWFYQPSSRRDMHAPEAWDLTTGDTSIVIAIVDTGLLPYHPELGGRVAGLPGQVWTNWAERGGLPGVDDDGNGFVDDVWGWDFVDLPAGSGVRPGEDGYDEDGDPNDFIGHGTNVAGLIGAIANNGSGVAGTVWQARLMPLRVSWASLDDPTGDVSLSYAAQAVRYATRMGARVINCSFSTQPYLALELAVSEATRRGVLVVTAAGNNGSPNAMGSREDVLTVAAIDADDVVARFSNLAPYVDIAAPGVNLATTALARTGTDSLGLRQPSYAATANGTSFATAFASGAAALVQARRRALGLPLLDPMPLILHLRETADDIASCNPNVAGYGTGRLDIARALAEPPRSRVVRAGGRSVGAAVVLPTNAGGVRVALVTSDAKLLILDGATADTVRVVDLPGPPGSGLAAAEMGGGRGVEMFVGLQDGRVAGYRSNGEPLPGWPVLSQPNTLAFSLGTALGDLDGDGELDVVCAGRNDGIWAWHADGTPFSAIPNLGFGGVAAPVALSDLDGSPGVEIIVAARDGFAHAMRWDGREAQGWPTYLGQVIVAAAPVVTAFGVETAPTVLLADGDRLRAVRGDASTRFQAPLWRYAVEDPALADLNGDGSDEVVIASGPYVTVFDSLGATLGGGRWPITVAISNLDPPIVGHVGVGGATGIVIRDWTGIIALDAAGAPYPGFPKPGGTGDSPTLAEIDGDGATELLTGTGLDSLLFLYDLGPGSWSATPQAWPTARGNFARTGSRLYAPPLTPIDGVPPVAVADLAAGAVSTTSVALHWTAPADASPSQGISAYDLRRATVPIGPGNFATATPVWAPPPSAPGSREAVVVSDLDEGQRYYFALRSRDANWNFSAVSDVVDATTARVLPAPVADLRVEAATDSSVTLRWTASGDDGTVGTPRHYQIAAESVPVDDAVFDHATIRRSVDALVAAGGVERRVVTGVPSARRLWFALKVEDRTGARSTISNTVSARTATGGPLEGRAGAALASRVQPARAPVEIYWQSAFDGEGSAQTIALYDLRGRQVRTLGVGSGVGGVIGWDGRDDRGVALGAGLYFARLSSGSARANARIMLLP